MESYVCAACGITWERKPTRGTRPQFCPDCRGVDGYGRFPRTCVVCQKEWRTTRVDAKYCSDSCKAFDYSAASCPVPWRNCLVCMKWFTTRTHRYDTCSPVCEAAATEVMKPTPQPHVMECVACGSEFTTRQSTALTCSKRCLRKVHRLRRKVREYGSQGEWRWSDFMRIAAKFDYCCAYCGVKPDRLDPDHVIPLAKQGPNTTTNLLPACTVCNCDKRDLDLDDWATDRERRGLPAVITDWRSDDSRFWHLTHLRSLTAAA